MKISHSRVRYEVEIELHQVSLGLERLVVVKEAAEPILPERDLWSSTREISPQFRQAFFKYGQSSPWLTTVETDGYRSFQIMPDAYDVGRTRSATNPSC